MDRLAAIGNHPCGSLWRNLRATGQVLRPRTSDQIYTRQIKPQLANAACSRVLFFLRMRGLRMLFRQLLLHGGGHRFVVRQLDGKRALARGDGF